MMKFMAVLALWISVTVQASVVRVQIDCSNVVSDSGRARDPWGAPKNFSISPLYYGHYQIIEISEVATGDKKRTIERDLSSCEFGRNGLTAKCLSDGGVIQAVLTKGAGGYMLRLGQGLEMERVMTVDTCVSKSVEVER